MNNRKKRVNAMMLQKRIKRMQEMLQLAQQSCYLEIAKEVEKMITQDNITMEEIREKIIAIKQKWGVE